MYVNKLCYGIGQDYIQGEAFQLTCFQFFYLKEIYLVTTLLHNKCIDLFGSHHTAPTSVVQVQENRGVCCVYNMYICMYV